MDPYMPLDPSIDYNKMPQRLHTYPASDRAKKIMGGNWLRVMKEVLG